MPDERRLFTFAGGSRGRFRVTRIAAVLGAGLDPVERLEVLPGRAAAPEQGGWALVGAVSNERYVTRPERERLVAAQQGLGRPDATVAALIPISKSTAWWQLPQDERRAIFEERSRHIAIGLRYLPPIARRLHHGRDLGEPFDFLTWFEYAPEHANAFEELVAALRETEEWKYVIREVDVRVERENAPDSAAG